MYAHLTVVQLPPDQLDTYVETLRSSGIPVLKEQPGYEAALVLADPQTGKAIAIAFFQTESDRQATEDSGFSDEHRARVSSSLDISRSTPEYYEVQIADGTFSDLTTNSFTSRTGQVGPGPGPVGPGPGT